MSARREQDFVAFYNATWQRTVACAYGMTGELSAAEDLAQEAYCRAWRRWRSIHHDDAGAWVRLVATRLAVSRWRRMRSSVDFLARSRDPEPAAPPSEETVLLVAALKLLPEASRRALVLHYLGDLFATVSADVAARTSAPGGQEAIAASRRRIAGVAVASVVAVLVGALSFTLLGGHSWNHSPAPASPTPTEGLDVGDVAVWYDDAGLHRGDVVEQAAVRVRTRGGPSGFSLVRIGPLYIDVVGRDLWFHPWGGEPRVVGHDSVYGAVGDPEGGTVAWFEGSELVVYDTARLREVTRVRTVPPAEVGGEHINNGHGIMQVSADSVVWATQDDRVLQLDSRSGEVTERPKGTGQRRDDPDLIDVHDETELRSSGALALMEVSCSSGLLARRSGAFPAWSREAC